MVVKLGQQVKDRVTDYEGIVVAVTEHLQGCRRITVQGKVTKEGTIGDGYVFDEPDLTIIGPGISEPPKPKKSAGGPHGIAKVRNY